MNNGLTELLRSKRFWAALLGVLVIIVSAINPNAGLSLEDATEAILIIIGLLVGGYAVEDVARAARSGEQKQKYTK